MDYLVKARSDTEIRESAHRVLGHVGISNREWVDVLALLTRESIWTVNGAKRLIYEARPDAEMGDNDATTAFVKNRIMISVKQSRTWACRTVS